MINPQQAANKSFEFIGAQTGSTRATGCDAGNRLKRRIDTRCEDYAYQVEAERRDLATVAVLGYN